MYDVGARGAISEEKIARDEGRNGSKSLLVALLRHHPELAPESLKRAIGCGLLRALQTPPEKLDAPVVISECWGASSPWPLPNMTGRHPVTIALMASAIHFGLDRAELQSQCRKPRRSLARQVAWHVVKSNAPDLSLPDIGLRSGGRDHTTVLHGIQTLPRKIAQGRLTEADVEAVTKLYWRMKNNDAMR